MSERINPTPEQVSEFNELFKSENPWTLGMRLWLSNRDQDEKIADLEQEVKMYRGNKEADDKTIADLTAQRDRFAWALINSDGTIRLFPSYSVIGEFEKIKNIILEAQSFKEGKRNE